MQAGRAGDSRNARLLRPEPARVSSFGFRLPRLTRKRVIQFLDHQLRTAWHRQTNIPRGGG
jgi:hypothetical protein